MIYMFLLNNPSSGDINLSNLPCLNYESQIWRVVASKDGTVSCFGFVILT